MTALTDWSPLAVLVPLSAVLAWLAIRVGIMDIPAGRKAHTTPTPKAGGIGPIGAFLAIFCFFPMLWTTPTLILATAATALGLVGFLDDMRDIGPRAKLIAQTLAAMAVVGAGACPTADGNAASTILAIGWLVFITNVFNFMDGLDGLAAGAGLLAALFLAAAAPHGGMVQTIALALAAGLAGFLPFNFPRARLFLGDTGSQFCGFLLGVLGLRLAGETGSGEMGDIGTLWLLPLLLAGMIADVSLTLVRRALAGANITTPHREHFYQRAPLPAHAVSRIHWAFVILGGSAWVLSNRAGLWPAIPILVLSHLAWLRFAQAGIAIPPLSAHPPGVRNPPRSW